MRVRSLGREDPLEEGMATHSSILAWEFHEHRSLEGYSLWGLKELDTTEATEHMCIYGLPWWLSGKESACQCKRLKRLGFDLWVGKIPWRRKW